MANKSAIEWTDATWNPVTGCDEVSPGCAHCYAKTFAERWRGTPGHAYENGFDLQLRPERLDQPLRWRRPRMVFVNSMSDLFHEEIPDEYVGQVFSTMARAKQHVFQVLTKRPERMRDVLLRAKDEMNFGPLPNVWLGVSIENRRFVHRADLLRQTPAAVRFISAEPLLGPLTPLVSTVRPERGAPGLDLTDIDWLIVGGESGPGHRRIDPQWVRDLRDATRACDPEPAFFFKQWGGARPSSGGRELDGRTWDEMPGLAEGEVVL